ncbi:MAG: hypothetical protein U0835_02270 [Isosphaeraceae bacterium]
MSDAFHVVSAIPWFAWIAIVGIICGSITSWIQMNHSHAERMAMIRQGMNPYDRDGKPLVEEEV